MANKYQPGDRVRIARKTETWNHNGEMDHWLGEVVTIKAAHHDWYEIFEDMNEPCAGSGWAWDEDCFEPYQECYRYSISDEDIESILEVM